MASASQLRAAPRLPERAHVAAATRGPAPSRRCVAARVASAPRRGFTQQQGCPVFIDENGEVTRVMCFDYGFRTGSARLYQEEGSSVPASVLDVGKANFKSELESLRRSFRYNEYQPILASGGNNLLAKAGQAIGSQFVTAAAKFDKFLEEKEVFEKLAPMETSSGQRLTPQDAASDEGEELRRKLAALQLDNDAVMRVEQARVAKYGEPDAPWYIRAPFFALCWTLDVVYNKRPIQRFWVLETVARIPYFAYISILHFYESLGFWRAGADLRKVHFAEEWNELHHLQIMETLGGDMLWFDRFVAQHAALLYYWVLILMYLASPRLAYVFSELVELHAADTYCEFVDANESVLKSLPPPAVAVNYYKNGDLYLFDEMNEGTRRPACGTLYDVFCAIRDDEVEHVKTMQACQSDKIAKVLSAKREKSSPLQ